jgi:hypothetical protein
MRPECGKGIVSIRLLRENFTRSPRRISMNKRLIALAGMAFLAVFALSSAWATRVGERAPDFTATDSNGQVQTLSKYAGKYVVLEWHNRGCPYTAKHYKSGNMERLQHEWTGKGVVWFTVISSAPGKQG